MSRQLPQEWRDEQGNLRELPALARDPSAPQVHIRSYRVITPLFGGGVEPQQADPITTVRASEVRGQLRFWWRATCAGRYGPDGLAQMKQAEDALWGSTKSQSLVEMEVRNVNEGTLIRNLTSSPRDPFLGDPIKSPISYAAFPLRRTPERPVPGGLRFGVTFDLAITLPTDDKLRNDVLAALWAWETFGGIGARTRRGFGALHCHAVHGVTEGGPWLPPTKSPQAVKQWLTELFTQFVEPGTGPAEVPRLSLQRGCRIGSSEKVQEFASDGRPVSNEARLEKLLVDNQLPREKIAELLPALIVWYYPLAKLREFRQQRRNNAQGRPYGRSFWPEPDEIRWRFPEGFRGRHSLPAPANRRRANKFPRAVFGLPILFQFKDNELETTTLQGVHHDRLASPLILRPLVCADETLVSLAIVLSAPEFPPDGLELKNAPDKTKIELDRLTPAEANFPPLNGQTDVIKAFLDTL
mgnify:CR=1 FL=1